MNSPTQSQNWSLPLRGFSHPTPDQVCLVFKDIAENLHCATAFLLVAKQRGHSDWQVPDGCGYSIEGSPGLVMMDSQSDFVHKALSHETSVIERDKVPKEFTGMGLTAVVGVGVGPPNRKGVLVLGRRGVPDQGGRFKLHFTSADVDHAVVYGRVISVNGLWDYVEKAKFPSELPEGKGVIPTPDSKNLWASEKSRLLQTHPGWYVAYSRGKRVALEPTLDKLARAIKKALGPPQRPACEFHEMVENPGRGRGPSPRLWPVRELRKKNGGR